MRNKQKVSEYKKQYYIKNKDKLLPRLRERSNKWCKDNREIRNQRDKIRRARQKESIGFSLNSSAQKRYRKRLKEEVVSKMGGCCVCCGATEIDFLTVDHVNNNGNEERKIFKPGGGSSWIMVKNQNYPKCYQLLCFNCNYSKYIGNGLCIHARKSPSNSTHEG